MLLSRRTTTTASNARTTVDQDYCHYQMQGSKSLTTGMGIKFELAGHLLCKARSKSLPGIMRDTSQSREKNGPHFVTTTACHRSCRRSYADEVAYVQTKKFLPLANLILRQVCGIS